MPGACRGHRERCRGRASSLARCAVRARRTAHNRIRGMQHSNILVIGGAGFIGRHIVARLTARGLQVTVPTRRRARARHLIMLPTIDVVECDVHDDATFWTD